MGTPERVGILSAGRVFSIQNTGSKLKDLAGPKWEFPTVNLD